MDRKGSRNPAYLVNPVHSCRFAAMQATPVTHLALVVKTSCARRPRIPARRNGTTTPATPPGAASCAKAISRPCKGRAYQPGATRRDLVPTPYTSPEGARQYPSPHDGQKTPQEVSIPRQSRGLYRVSRSKRLRGALPRSRVGGHPRRVALSVAYPSGPVGGLPVPAA